MAAAGSSVAPAANDSAAAGASAAANAPATADAPAAANSPATADAPAAIPAAANSAAAPTTRIEARSADYLAVGSVHAARMVVHLSRISDNAPVHDADLTVRLRGVTHAAVAEPDGSYSIQTPDLDLPGAAAMQFQITAEGRRQTLSATLEPSTPSTQAEGRSSSRQLGWWVLNFAVCIGFLMLWSRRRKRAEGEDV